MDNKEVLHHAIEHGADSVEYEWSKGIWLDLAVSKIPFKDFLNAAFQLRIKAVPDYIDWSQVSPEFKYMARCHNGAAFLFTDHPIKINLSQGFFKSSKGDYVAANVFSSFKRGTVSIDESLVERPVDESLQTR